MFPSQLGLLITFFLLSIPHPILSSFETFTSYSVSPLPELTNNNWTLQQYFRMLDLFHANGKQQIPYIESEFPGISNLNEQLTPFTTANCLISLCNFRYIDIFAETPLEYPILLWTPELGQIDGLNTWMPKDFNKKISVTTVNYSLSCNTSNLLGMVGYVDVYTGICLDLDILTYSSHSKPWNCQVDMYLYQPERKYGESYPTLFPRISADFINALIYYRVPSVKVFVYHDTFQSVDSRILGKLIVDSVIDSRRRPVNYAYLYLSVTSNSKSSGVIGFVKIVRECQRCSKKSNDTEVEMSRTLYIILYEINLKITPLEILERLSHPAPSEYIHWSVTTQFPTFRPTESAIFQLSLCDKRLFNAEYLLHARLDLSAVEKLAKAYAHVWLSIMKNSTFQLTDDKLATCYPLSDKVKLESSYDDSFRYYIPVMTLEDELLFNSASRGLALEIPLDLSSLKFVSCGRRALQSMAFRELIDVYDPAVWAFVGLSILILMMASEQLSRGTGWMSLFNIYQHWLPIFKAIIEQGNPFPSRYLKTSPLRLVFSVLMLAMIVLSNAYKNTNVYNMIAPRNPVPYKYLKELVHDNFVIFGRSTVVGFYWLNHEIPSWSNVSISRHYLNVGGSVEVFSEIQRLLWRLYDMEDAELTKTYNDSIRLMEQVEQATDLHPQLISVLKSRFEEIESINPFPFMPSREIKTALQERFWTKEDLILADFIDQCNRTALVLPQHLCMKHAYRLQRLKRDDVFVGEETYVNNLYTFSLTYRIPSFIIKRLSGSKESGIWEWWLKLAKGGYKLYQTRKVLTKPNLDGNVLVIFSLLCIGLVVACAILVLENWKYFWSTAMGVSITVKKCLFDRLKNCYITPILYRPNFANLFGNLKIKRIAVLSQK
ncbi:unnamed protein product [Orchesella dallaii]|uniref:Ionotropic receptor n=1 Tax=Orchesella dallaii TaxID=48710 RepID=A0ABP1R6Z1_9HEXA